MLIALYALIGAAVLFPVFATTLPPLADLPNHLARVYIMNHLGQNADLQRYYALHWRLLGFQSPDFTLPILARLVGLNASAQLYIFGTFAALVGGVVALHRALFGKVGLWPAASAIVLYNFMFAWGLLSFLFAFGLSMLLFAAWIATRPKDGALRAAFFAVAAVGLFLCHFFAFAVYALLVGMFELGRLKTETGFAAGPSMRRLGFAAATLVVPAILFVWALDSSAPTITQYGGIDDKIRAILSPTTMYINRPDFALCMAIPVLVWIGRRLQLFALAPAMHLPLLAVLAFAIAMPSELASVWGADFRLPTVAALLLIAASDLRLPTPRHAMVFVAVLAALVLFRVGFITSYWNRYAADFDELRAATAVIDRGSRVVVMQSLDDHRSEPAPSLFPYRHVASLAVIERDVFLPHLFVSATPLRFIGVGQELATDQLAVLRHVEWHPIQPAFRAVSPETAREAEAVGRSIQLFDLFTSTIDWSSWAEHFDYLVDLHFGRPENPVPALLTDVAQGSYFTIYRIHPPALP